MRNKQILLGTHNKAKLDELKYHFQLFKIKGFDFIIPKDLNLDSPPEIEDTFEGNAILKAKYYYEHSKLLTLADDTGLCIEVLNGKPGVHTADWANEHGGYIGLFKKIKSEIQNLNVNEKDVKAKAVCVLCWYEGDEVKTYYGEIKGKLDFSYIYNEKAMVKNGEPAIGFQPVFIPENSDVPVSLMNRDEWLKSNHRYNAFKKLVADCF